MSEFFESRLDRWQRQAITIKKMQEEQRNLADDISTGFGDIVTRDQLLAGLPWEVVMHARVTIKCKIKDEKVGAFIEMLEWDDRRFHWHHSLQIGEYYVNLDDGMMSISFKDIDEMVAFCKEQGIKPRVTMLNDQRKKAQSDVDRLTGIIRLLAEG